MEPALGFVLATGAAAATRMLHSAHGRLRTDVGSHRSAARKGMEANVGAQRHYGTASLLEGCSALQVYRSGCSLEGRSTNLLGSGGLLAAGSQPLCSWQPRNLQAAREWLLLVQGGSGVSLGLGCYQRYLCKTRETSAPLWGSARGRLGEWWKIVPEVAEN
jgi:hypothetical protein